MILKNGKFFEGDKVVPLEFGNKKQILLLEAVKQLKTEGAIPRMVMDGADKQVGISLICVCGGTVACGWETDDELEDIEGTTVKCSGCDFIYKVCSDEFDFLYFKLIKP